MYIEVMKIKLLQIGEVAALADVSIQAIRYYERIAVLKPVKRKDSGLRLYDAETVKTLKFLKRAQDLGFSLDDIKELIFLRSPSTERCGKVKKKAVIQLNTIEDKIRLLKQMEKNLKKLISNCNDQTTSSKCPIIEGMEE